MGSDCEQSLEIWLQVLFVLVFFHSFTGCDTTSSFINIGKKKAYETLKAYPEIEAVFANFYTNPFKDFDEDDKIKKTRRFVVLIYSRTSARNNVNEALIDIYVSQNSETIPPTKNALLLHTKRVLFQSGVWMRG